MWWLLAAFIDERIVISRDYHYSAIAHALSC
jgi:hypothetical protein